MAIQFIGDYISNRIIEEAIATVKRELGIDISRKQAIDIIKSQTAGIKFAMENKFVAKVKGLGRFIIKEGREQALEASKEAKGLGLKGEERNRWIAQFKRDNADSINVDKMEITRIDGTI